MVTLHKQRGMTLIELMISIVIGLIVTATMVAIFSTTASTNNKTLRITHLDQDLRALMNAVTRETRRAGYWAGVEQIANFAGQNSLGIDSKTGTVTADFEGGEPLSNQLASAIDGLVIKVIGFVSGTAPMAAYISAATTDTWTITIPSGEVTGEKNTWDVDKVAAGDWMVISPTFATINVSQTPATGIGDCIKFGYDRDDDSRQDAGSEEFGFRHNSGNNTLEIRQNGESCAGSGWVALNDNDEILITDFNVSATTTNIGSTGSLSLDLVDIDFILTGQLTDDANVTRTLTQRVKVRNELLK